MDRQAFKQRMQNLKSYRENNPGKGYWDWKDERTDHPIKKPTLPNEEELRYYFDLLVSRYCLPDKEYDIEESESEEDIDEAIDELKHEINELKEIQQI